MTADPILTDVEAAPTRGGTPHLRPVGPIPPPESLLICALMYAPPALVLTVAENIDAAVDCDQPAATLLTAIVDLARNGIAPAPVLVLDEMRRQGKADRRTATYLASASTAGAPPESARKYAAVVVADSLRRQTESLGTALQSAASSAAEIELRHLVTAGSQRIQATADRLKNIRGEHD